MKFYQKLSLLAATVGVTAITVANEPALPRGADVDLLAGNCNIGPFPQTTKAGPYNALCNVMQDAEKCLGLIKGAFFYNGETVTVYPFYPHEKEKGLYCMEILKRDLGLQ